MMSDKKMPDGAKKFIALLKKNKYVVIVLIVGIIILLLPTGSSSSDKEDKAQQQETREGELEFSVEEQEEKIANALSEIYGAGQVTVVLSLKTTMEQEVAVDEDSSGGEETVTVSTGTGTESPVTIKYIYPEYKGALIVAEGADSAEVRLQITQAVSSLTGLGTDKISVINKEN